MRKSITSETRWETRNLRARGKGEKGPGASTGIWKSLNNQLLAFDGGGISTGLTRVSSVCKPLPPFSSFLSISLDLFVFIIRPPACAPHAPYLRMGKTGERTKEGEDLTLFSFIEEKARLIRFMRVTQHPSIPILRRTWTPGSKTLEVGVLTVFIKFEKTFLPSPPSFIFVNFRPTSLNQLIWYTYTWLLLNGIHLLKNILQSIE